MLSKMSYQSRKYLKITTNNIYLLLTPNEQGNLNFPNLFIYQWFYTDFHTRGSQTKTGEKLNLQRYELKSLIYYLSTVVCHRAFVSKINEYYAKKIQLK